jgi:hypothetical protein
MKWKEVMKRRKLLSLSVVAVATLATMFFLYSTIRTTTPPTSADTSPALPTNADGGDVLQALGSTGSGTPPGSFTPNQLAYNFDVDSSVATKAGAGHVVQGSDGTGSNTLAEDFNDYPEYDYDFQAIESGGDVGQGSDGTGSNSNTPPEDFTPILLANNDYPGYDYDLQAGIQSRGIESGGDVGQGRGSKSTAPDTSPGSVNEAPSHVPEPASMLLLGSALVGIAVFGRKRLFRE